MNINYMGLKAKKNGNILLKHGISKCPKPIITKTEILNLSKKYKYFKVGQRSLNNIFILMNNCFATVYVRPEYTCYRLAYKSIIKTQINNKDVDHLFPRSKAAKGEFIALGFITKTANRSHNANLQTLPQKALGYKKVTSKSKWAKNSFLKINSPKPRELGLLVKNGYLINCNNINLHILTEI